MMKIQISLLLTIVCSANIYAACPPPYYDQQPTNQTLYPSCAGCLVYDKEDLVDNSVKKSTGSTLSSLTQQAYDEAAALKNVDQDSIQEFIKSLKISAQKGNQEVQLDGLLYGTSEASCNFNQELIKQFARHVHCSLGVFINTTEKKEYLAAAYLGTPFALKLFERLSPTSTISFLTDVLDGKLIREVIEEHKLVPDYEAPPSAPLRYVSITTERGEIIRTEPLEQTIAKFPALTVVFLKGYFKAMQ